MRPSRLRFAQRLFRQRDLQAGALRRAAPTGKPSVRRRAFIMNSNTRSSRPTSWLSCSGRPSAHPLEIFLGLLPAGAARDAVGKAELAVRARSDAEVVPEAPVVEIVAALAARPRPGRGLVVSVAGPRERARRWRPASPADASSSGSTRRMPVEVRVRLDRQVVERQVRRPRRRSPTSTSARASSGRLPGQRVHQIEIDVVEMLAARSRSRARASRSSWMRPSASRCFGSKLWMPIERRVTPASR